MAGERGYSGRDQTSLSCKVFCHFGIFGAERKLVEITYECLFYECLFVLTIPPLSIIFHCGGFCDYYYCQVRPGQAKHSHGWGARRLPRRFWRASHKVKHIIVIQPRINQSSCLLSELPIVIEDDSSSSVTSIACQPVKSSTYRYHHPPDPQSKSLKHHRLTCITSRAPFDV